MQALTLLPVALAGYLIGSFPFAWILARVVTGRDLRQMGSGNVGVMNVAISVARWAGWLVFFGEAAKGIGAVLLARALVGTDIAIGTAVLGVVVGTRWPVWLRGAGGRGNTAGGAALLTISWPSFLLSIGLWFGARYITKKSFIATRVTMILAPVIFGLLTRSWWYLIFAAALGLIYIGAQRRETDDHMRITSQWPSLWAFLTAPRRERPLPSDMLNAGGGPESSGLQEGPLPRGDRTAH